MGDDHDAMVTVERASDRYRHVRFLSGPDSASPASSRLRSTVRRPGAATRSGSRPNAEPLEPEAKRFVECLLRRAGLDPNCYRGAPLARRVGACLRSLHARSIPEAYRRLEGAPERAAEALDSLLIGATQFFREPEVFSYLDEAVLRNFSACGDGLRVWSAGCADGAELYSLAMLLAGQGLLEGSTLVGTDCRADAIRQAEQGWFEPIRLQSLDARLRQTYFIQDRHGWKVCAALRRA